MPLIELVLSVCSASNPADCRQVVHPDAKRESQLECVLSAPIEAAQWGKFNPKWTVKKSECKRTQ